MRKLICFPNLCMECQLITWIRKYRGYSINIDRSFSCYPWTYNGWTKSEVKLLRDGLLHCWSWSKCMHFGIINHLDIEVLVGAEDTKSWPFSSYFNLKLIKTSNYYLQKHTKVSKPPNAKSSNFQTCCYSRKLGISAFFTYRKEIVITAE